MVAGGRNHHNLRSVEGRPAGAADVAEITKQVKMVTGTRSYLKLRLSPESFSLLAKLVVASQSGLFRAAA